MLNFRKNGTLPLLLALLLIGLVACDGDPPAAEVTTPVSTTVMDALAAPPTPSPTATAEPVRPTAAPEVPAGPELYGNFDEGLALRLPNGWHLREGAPIRIATSERLLDSLDVASDDVVVLLYSDRSDDFLGGLPAEMTAVDVANAFTSSGRLSNFGRVGELLLPFESTRINGLDAAVGALRVITTEGATGTAYVTSIVSQAQKALLIALTVAPTDEAILSDINDVTDSLELLGIAGGVRRTGRFSVAPAGTPNTANHHLLLEGGTRLLVLLETDADSNGVLTLRNADGTELVTVNQGGNGVSEALYYVPPVTAIYAVEIGEAGGDAGNYVLHAVDVRPGAEAVQLFREQEYDPERPIEFTFFGTTAEPLLIYVEPLGTNARFMDPVLEILDAETNFYARVDDRYQGEPEALYFEPAADGNYMARISDFFDARGAYRIMVAVP